MIADRLGVDKGDVHSADRLSADLVARYDVLLLGTSTWATANCKTTGTTASGC